MKFKNYWGFLTIALLNVKEYSRFIIEKKKLDEHLVNSNLIILICTLIYGAVTGFFLGGIQILINAIKIPIIVFSLIYISMPIFLIFNIFINKRFNLKQIAMVLLSGFTISSLIMVAFAPVNLLFCITTVNVHFIVLLNTGIGVMAILCGLFYIFKLFHEIHQNGNEYVSLIMGYSIILFSAPQLLWTFRPYFHHIDGFFEPIKSNFYVEILKVVEKEPLLTLVLVLIFSLVSIFIIYNITEDHEAIGFNTKEHKPKNIRKKRSIKKIKEIPQIKTISIKNSRFPPHQNQKNQYSKYPNYLYPYYSNPYWYKYSNNNSDQK